MIVQRYFLFAAWAVHITKVDLQGARFVFKHLRNAVGMEDVPARKRDTCFFPKIRSITNSAQFGLLGVNKEATLDLFAFLFTLGKCKADILNELYTGLVLARKVPGLACYSIAVVSTRVNL